MNDIGRIHVRMPLEAHDGRGDRHPAKTFFNHPAPPARTVSVHGGIVQRAESHLEGSGAAQRSSGDASQYRHETMARATIVIQGFTAADISNPFATDLPNPAEQSIIFAQTPSIVQSAGPTETSGPIQEHDVQATNEPPRTPRKHGLSTSELTTAIVVPIVVIALLTPLLVLWCLSSRRRKKTQRTRSRRYSPQETAGLEKRMQENLARAREEWSPPSLFPTKGLIDLSPPARLPLRKMRRPRSVQQLRTSDIANDSLSGFNFDFSRRGTMFSKRSAQPSPLNPNHRHSGTSSWDPGSPYLSRPTSATPPHVPTRTQTPQSPPSEIGHPEGQFPPSSEASLGLLAGERAETGSGRDDISSTASLRDERSPHDTSNHPLSDAISEVSGMSVETDLWTAPKQSGQDGDNMSDISALEPHPGTSVDPNQIV
jgi:hypothetical protein